MITKFRSEFNNEMPIQLKKCFKCQLDKPITEYYVHQKMKDGYLGKCKDCTKNDTGQHRLLNIDRIRKYDRERSRLPHRVQLRSDICERYRENYPLRVKAVHTLNNAVRDRRVKKLNNCQFCNGTERLEGHHYDYSKPLDVIWLCVLCHRNLHSRLNKNNTHMEKANYAMLSMHKRSK
jgi:hypothetical protein